MIDFDALIKKTEAYKIISAEKKAGKLAHAYLIVCADKENLKSYLKGIAKLILCDSENFCGKCRACVQTEEENYADVYFYPTENKISTDDVVSLISESYVKPIEGDKKVFVLTGADEMLAPAQNKLLKTLEEPPKNVYILLGATTEYPILSTVKSRVRKLKIDSFEDGELFNALKNDYPDSERLKNAISLSNGNLGSAISFYSDEKLEELFSFTDDLITDMQSSKQVLAFSTRFFSVGSSVTDFLSVLELKLRDMLLMAEGGEKLVKSEKNRIKLKGVAGYNVGSIIHALEKIAEARERKKFNANDVMLVEWLFFQILEGKYKWQK